MAIDHDDGDGDGDGAPAGITLFCYWSWLDQAAHGSRLYSGVSCWSLEAVAGLEERREE